MLDLRQLTALRAVADHGSILGAANALAWSQPTVAHHLRGLAAVAGAPAVESTPAGTHLTPVGEVLLRHAIALLDRADRAVSDAREFVAAAQARVSLGIFPSAGARLLPALVRTLDDAGYAVEVTEAELDRLTVGLEELELDAAVLYSAPDHPVRLPSGMRGLPVRSEKLTVIVPADHPQSGRRGVPLTAFRDDPWVLGNSPDDPVDRALLAAAAAAGFTPRRSVRSDDYAVISAYVAAGFGVALVPELALPPHPEGIALVDVAGTAFERRIFLATAVTLPEAARTALVAALRVAQP
jgi:DNA-binding transcriptional LysR family regulator